MANFDRDPSLELADPIEQPPADNEPSDRDSTPDDAPSSHHKPGVVREYFESIVVTFIMALFGMTFITQAVKVPTGSMLNTILVEDHLMVNKFLLSSHPSWLDHILPYREIRRGDIIVFKYPVNPEENYVKRVIGLPGDEVLVRGTRVYINGEVLPENKVIVAMQGGQNADLEPIGQPRNEPGATYSVFYSQTSSFEDDEDARSEKPFRSTVHAGESPDYGVYQAYTVPEGHYFCLGDNRENSLDSRYWGAVPRENVIGRAMFVYWSIDESARQENPGSNLLTEILTYTRWGRTGTLIK